MDLTKISRFFLTPALVALVSFATGCSSARKNTTTDQVLQPQVPTTEAQIADLNKRIEQLQTDITAMNDKVTATRIAVDAYSATRLENKSLPSRAGGITATPLPTKLDPQAAYVNDEAIQAYREAKILFDGGKYQDAVVKFSGFLKDFADHPLAGSAQFYIGESYSKQGEDRLALPEYEHVLVSYDGSPHLSETLAHMAAIEDKLLLKEAAAKHRQLLLSLFPQSPAASGQKLQATEPTAPGAPAAAPAIDPVPVTTPLPEGEKTNS